MTLGELCSLQLVIPSRPQPQARTSEESAVKGFKLQIPRSARDDKSERGLDSQAGLSA